MLAFSELFFLTNIQWAIPFGYYDNGFKELNLKPNYNFRNKDALIDLNNGFKKSRVSVEKSGNDNFEGNTYYRNNKRFNINHINNWGNDNHAKLFKKYFNSNGKTKNNLDSITIDNVKYFFGMDKQAKKIFYSKSINHIDIHNFVKDSKNYEINDNFKFEIVKYTGDELVINVETLGNGWVSFIDTWDHNWHVYINNNKENFMKLFGTYKSIRIKPGNSQIRFAYKPFNLNFSKNRD